MATRKVKIHTGGGKKGFAGKEADPNTTAEIVMMNRFTKVFDLIVTGETAKAEKRLKGWSDKAKGQFATYLDKAHEIL